MIQFWVLYTIMIVLLALLGKALQKMVKRGFERAGLINDDKAYLEAKKRVLSQLENGLK